MRNRLSGLSAFFIIVIWLVSCEELGSDTAYSGEEGDAVQNSQSETFDASNRPGLEYNSIDGYYLVKPWNYEKDFNATRKYPLLIYLHGSSQDAYLKNLAYMGMGYYDPGYDGSQPRDPAKLTSEYKVAVADVFRKTYPCFTWVPQGTSWSNSKLIAQMEQLIAGNRIDTDRIYLHGFSMGGDSCFSLPKAYYASTGKFFAGIIRLTMSGDFGTTLDDAIVPKTPVWLLIGLKDSTSRVNGIQHSYDFLKNHSANAGAIETSRLNYLVSTQAANTLTLTKGDSIVVRKTEFPNKDHFITDFPFADPEMFQWLFSQTLAGK